MPKIYIKRIKWLNPRINPGSFEESDRFEIESEDGDILQARYFDEDFPVPEGYIEVVLREGILPVCLWVKA